ncbi:unnamed protein product [Nesidiocoris tenuis]|uniref:Invertebrate defensins family profile domain-containing protein n=1 Tax=Nesidiocoris tenuis TaxID=355587 RepID=A0A6H5FWW7_9HEMI|nr:unnamed protein product [Nesidiocoris tenuis]
MAFLYLVSGDVAPEEVHVRSRRAACDLLEITGNAACAAHCIWLGNRGGKCHGTVCHCRK